MPAQRVLAMARPFTSHGLGLAFNVRNRTSSFHCAVARARAVSTQAVEPGRLFVCGMSKTGALGLGESVTSAKEPTPVPCSEDVVDVACGKHSTLFVTVSGKVFSMGDNSNGELGTTKPGISSFDPVPVEGLDGVKIKQVAAGLQHALALSEDGRVFSWGWGGSTTGGVGALGHGNKEAQPVPKQIEALSGVRVKSVACGGKHSGALAEDGSLYTWGQGEQGRLGHGNNTDLLEPKRIEDAPQEMSFLDCGDAFCAAIGRDGTLYTWGKNKVGELGLEGMSVFAQESEPTALEREECFANASIVHVACGVQHCLAVTEDGKLYVWGAAGFSHHTPARLNPLSVPSLPAERQVVRVGAGNCYSAAIGMDGTVYVFGRNRQWLDGFTFIGKTNVLGLPTTSTGWGEVEPREVPALKDVQAVACGHFHTAFIAL